MTVAGIHVGGKIDMDVIVPDETNYVGALDTAVAASQGVLDEEGAVAEATRCLQCDLRLLISTPIMAPEKISWMECTEENVNDSIQNEIEGVVQLYDEQKNVIYIKGTMNSLNELKEQLE